MQDGLYLNNVWVAEVDPAINYQSNDLTKPDTIQVTYSLSFSLPDTLTIRDLTENAEQPNAGGKYPYATFDAKLISEGVNILPNGKAQLTNFNEGWKVNLFQATRTLFEVLSSRSIRSLNLSRYDHPWTVAGINALAGAKSGAVYPAVDYGNFDKDVFASDAVFPSVYARTIIDQALSETGYRPVGDWLQDDLLNQVALPFVNDEGKSHDEQWVRDRTARVTVKNSLQMSSSDTTEVLYEFNQDNDAENNFYDGKLDNFKPNLGAYVCDTSMRLHVQVAQTFKLKVTTGAVEAMLIVERNGQNVAQEYYSVSGVHNITFTAETTLKLDEKINCRAGDQIRIRFILRRRTLVGRFLVLGYIDPTTCWAEFVPDASLQPGDTWLVAPNLPEMTCAEVLKSVALFCSATLQVDEFRKTVTLVRVDEVVSKTGQAVDWSAKVEESQSPDLAVTLEPYGQQNRLRWAELEGVSPYGDGRVLCDAQNLPAEAELFTLPFAACIDSDKTLGNYGKPVQIKTRKITGSGTSRTVERNSTTPRLILIEPSKTVIAKANVVTPDGVEQVEELTLTAAWWGERPQGAKTPTNAFSLSFDRLGFSQREEVLTQRYFRGLGRVLRRPRLLTVSLILQPDDVASLDLTRPIKLDGVRAGALFLSGFYLLNKVNNYRPGYPCNVSLIAF